MYIYLYTRWTTTKKPKVIFRVYFVLAPVTRGSGSRHVFGDTRSSSICLCVCVWGGGGWRKRRGQKHRLFFICLLDICYLTNLLRQQLMANIQLSLENSLDSKVFPADCHVVQCRDYCIFLQRTIFVVLIFIFSNFKNKATTCGENNRRSG